LIELKFLGTGALGRARVKSKLSKDYRRFSTLLINNDLIIDPSEDVFEFAETFQLRDICDGIETVLITSSEPDKLSTNAVERLSAKKRRYVCASQSVCTILGDLKGASILPVEPFSIIEAKNYRIIPLPANHATEIRGEMTYSYLITCEEKNILYAPGASFINPVAWQFLREMKLDVVILDCALGDLPYSEKCVSFNNLALAGAVKDIMTGSKVADESTKFILTNMPSGRKMPTHEQIELAIENEKLPFRVAYDGYFTHI